MKLKIKDRTFYRLEILGSISTATAEQIGLQLMKQLISTNIIYQNNLELLKETTIRLNRWKEQGKNPIESHQKPV